ncbi:MAG TPA: chemotaxis protein CheW [Steroidobacteraceae bacterium]|nr:chemotaxis protein CheW [Steroidobacteraceae bacterium]
MAAAMLDDCWRRIGVHGDRSCPELTRHIHCRNCPTYAAAGRRVLDTPMPAQYREEWAGQLARPITRPERHTGSAVVFRVGVEWFGIPTELCSGILPERSIHSLPHRRGGPVLGLANVEGTLVLCISLAAVLGLAFEDGQGATFPDPRATVSASPRTAGGSARLLVVASPQGRLALPIQEAHGVCRFRERDLHAVPATLAKCRANHTRAVLPLAERAVALLDTESLFRSLAGHFA